MRRRQSSPHRAVPASTGGRQLQAAALSTPAPPPSHDPLQFKGGWFELLSNWTDFSTSTLEVKNGSGPTYAAGSMTSLVSRRLMHFIQIEVKEEAFLNFLSLQTPRPMHF
jgi:hypothetical protein